MSEVLNLTCELIRLKSVSPNDAGCLKLVLKQLAPAFSAEWFDFGDTRNLLLSHGTGSPHLMFLGHVDVVPAGDESSWSSPPFEASIRDGKLYGRGACDMKSAVAAMTIALRRFADTNPSHHGTVSLLLTSDEEGSNINAIPKVVEEFKKRNFKIDYCLVGEPTSREKLADTLKIGRRGTLSGKLIIHGIQGHIAYPQLADNPIHSFAPVLSELVKYEWDNGDQFFEPTSLQFSNISAGSGATNVIPAALEAKFNFRFSPLQTTETLMQQFESFLKDRKFSYEITWYLGGLPFITRGGKFAKLVGESVNKKLGYLPCHDTGGGTSDARFIAPLGTEVLELGLRGESLHKVDEFVRIDELEPLAELYQTIAEEILL